MGLKGLGVSLVRLSTRTWVEDLTVAMIIACRLPMAPPKTLATLKNVDSRLRWRGTWLVYRLDPGR